MKITDAFSQYKGLRKENYILFIGRIVTNLGAMVWPVMTLILNQKMGLDATTVALLMTAATILLAPVSLLGGKIADKYNKRNVIIICDIVSVTLYIICGLVPISYISLVFIFVASIFQSIEGPSYDALTADINVTKDREKAYSLLYLGSNIGLIASPTIAGALFKNHLGLSFVISGISIGISTVLIALFIKDIRPVKEENFEGAVYQESDDKANVFEILKKNKVLIVYIAIMAFYWSSYNQYSYLMPLDMAKAHGEDGALIYGSVSSLNCIIVVLFTPFITKLFAKVSYTKKLVVSVVLVAVGYTIFLLGLGFIPVYYAAITMFTWGEIFATISCGPYLTERIPSSHRGRINSVMGLIQTVIFNVVMISVGLFHDNVGSAAAWIFVLAMLGIAGICSLVLVGVDKKAYPALYVKKQDKE